MCGVKEIFAIIRSGKDRETKKALEQVGCFAMSSVRVHGRGKQRGLRYSSSVNDSTVPQFVVMKYLPKKLLYLVVNDSLARVVTQTIIRVNQTGEHGDGKIFILNMGDALRIRTGEKGESALR